LSSAILTLGGAQDSAGEQAIADLPDVIFSQDRFRP
jgi:hypothetical protein